MSWAARAKAASLHLTLSCIAVGALALSMWLLWYRPPYFFVDGGWHVLRILVAVDVVLGPVLTFIVFNRAKPDLKRDLAIIAAIQIGAFIYGAGALYTHRPAFVVAAETSLYCVNWREVGRAGGDLAQAGQLARGQPTPAFVYSALPPDPAERAALWKTAAEGGPLPIHQARLFETMSPVRWDTVLRTGSELDALATGDASIAAELGRVRAAHPAVPAVRMGFVPLSCRYGLIMLVLDRETRTVIDWMN